MRSVPLWFVFKETVHWLSRLDVHWYYTKTGQHHQTNEGAQRCTYALNWLPTRLTDHQQRSHAAAVAISWTALWMLCKFPSDHDCFQSKLNYLHGKKNGKLADHDSPTTLPALLPFSVQLVPCVVASNLSHMQHMQHVHLPWDWWDWCKVLQMTSYSSVTSTHAAQVPRN